MAKDNEARSTPQLHVGLAQLAEHARRVWLITVPSAHERNDLLDPKYWAHIAGPKRFAPGDEIIALAEDGTWRWHLQVLAAGPLFAKLGQISDPVEFGTVDESEIAGFEVKHKGRIKKWCVVREADGAIVSEGHSDKPTAYAWLASNEKSLTA